MDHEDKQLVYEVEILTADHHEVEVKVNAAMERHISESLDNKTLTEITTWKNGFFNTGIGFVHKIDPLNKKIQIK